MKARIEKVVSQLPATLEKNTVYYVRVANGFDIYVTNSAGMVAAYPANYASKNHTHAEYVSIADTQTIYGQKNFWTYSGGNWYNNTMVIYSDGSANPAISFYKTGIDAAQLVFNGATFSFIDSVSNNFVPVRANGFKKLGLTDDYCLLAGGGHVLFKQFKKLQFVSNLNTVVESGIYREEGPISGYFYTTTLNMNSSDGRQQLTIERSGGGMKFRGTPYGDGDQGFSDWRTVLTQELNESVTGLKMINRAQGNYASGWGLSKDRNTYSMIFDTNLGSSNNNNYGTALGFYSSVGLNNEVHASIIVRNNSASGTSMGFATTDSFAIGPQLAVSIANNGLVNFERQIPTFQNKFLATQEWVSTSYIPKTHPAYGINQNYLSGWFTYKGYGDVRVLRPENIETQKLQFGFTSWNNNNDYPFADFLHFGGYSDSSGGNQNLIAFKKNGFGLRQWQGTSQSPATYQSFVDYWNTDNFNPDSKVNKSGDTMTGKLNVLGGLSVVGNNVGSHNTKLFLKNNSASKAWAISAGIEGVFEENLAFGIWDENNQSFGAHFWIQNDGLIVTNNYGSSLNWYQAYNWGNHANAGYATQNWVTTNFAAKNHNHPEYQPAGNYVTQSVLDSQLLSYATQAWVNNNFTTQSWVSNNFLSASSFTKEVKIENSEARLTPFDLIVYSNFNMFDTDNRLVYVTLSDGGDIVMKNIFRFQNIHIMNTSDKFGVFKVENTNIAIEIESHTTMNAYVNGDGRLVNISGGTAYLI